MPLTVFYLALLRVNNNKEVSFTDCLRRRFQAGTSAKTFAAAEDLKERSDLAYAESKSR